MIRAVPVINTSRLTLRALRIEDFDQMVEIWEEPEVVRYISGKPRSRGRTWAAFLQNAGQWLITGFGQWAIEDRGTRTLIGHAGFFNKGRDLGSDFDECPEAGWVLATASQGKGLGAEAVHAVHEWYDRVIPGPLVAMIEPGNTASHRLALELGYSVLRKVEFKGVTTQLYRRDKVPQI